ncbi:MAG TPA: hypothetical protein VGB55_13545, partial [Tepidisphaeraceae bacterium]
MSSRFHFSTRSIRQQPLVEPLEGRQLLADSGFGININDASSKMMVKAIPHLRELGITSVRLWVGVDDFNKPKLDGAILRAIDYADAGFDVLVTVNPQDNKVTDPDAVRHWFKWAVSNPKIKAAVDRWEIGNEPDSDYYWEGSLKQYVTEFLKPASEVLRAVDEPVVSGGPSWNPEDVGTMIKAGMLNHVDYVGYHPYARGVKLVKQRVNEINAIVAGRRPIIASEWNVRGVEDNEKAWSQAVHDIFPTIAGGFAMHYYFGLTALDKTPAGPAGILKADGSKNPLFYDAVDSARDVMPNKPKPPAKPTAPTSPPSPTKPTPRPEPTPPAEPAEPAKPAPRPRPTPTKPAPSRPTKPTVPAPEPSTPAPKPATPKPPAKPTPPPAPVIKPVLTQVSLVNADTDEIIPGFENLSSGAQLDLANVQTRNIAIIAKGDKETESVKFSLDGNVTYSGGTPYSAFGMRRGNILGRRFENGSYSLAVTPWSKAEGRGVAGVMKTLNFSVTNSAARPPVKPTKPNVPSTPSTPSAPAPTKSLILGFQLIDARTNRVIRGYELITRPMAIAISTLGSGNVRLAAVTTRGVESVVFKGMGKKETLNDT